MLLASKSWQGKETNSHLTLQKKMQLGQHFEFSIQNLVWNSELQTVR